MCGILGFLIKDKLSVPPKFIVETVNNLFLLSETRGKEASGVAFLLPEAIHVAKHNQSASDFIMHKEYREIFKTALNNKMQIPLCIIGHSRLVTNGSQDINENNQPVIKDDIIGIHNGIITNVDDLWKQYHDLKRSYDIDTEIILSLIRKYFEETKSIIFAVQKTFSLIEGGASISLLFADLDICLIATNTGSLYMISDATGKVVIFASEKFILQELSKLLFFREVLPLSQIVHVKSRTGCIINLNDFHTESFSLLTKTKSSTNMLRKLIKPREIVNVSSIENRTVVTHMAGQGPYILSPSFVDEYPRNHLAIKNMRRCTNCILPETMPFIEFDSAGVCNYCRSYKKVELKGMDALMDAVDPYRKGNGEPECLVTFSGGRDSSYGVHIVKNILKMQPITYTYDWGMVTDLARRNQMRICGKLGIEHILVSADIVRKRSNIRGNVIAWLKKPNLGTVPLFMAGDKQYFYYANKISKQIDCQMIVLCENPLETTRFKTGFCGVPPRHSTAQTYGLSFYDTARMALFYGWQYTRNPSYLNKSIWDTLQAFICYYFIPHPYLNLFQYIKWDEVEISKTLIDNYNWETANDTQSTWRIGDGTAAFYNYIYYTMAGLSENDTFRSNQIREGMLSRDQALQLAERDNEPRYDSIQWYCDIIGIDFDATIKSINSAPKLY